MALPYFSELKKQCCCHSRQKDVPVLHVNCTLNTELQFKESGGSEVFFFMFVMPWLKTIHNNAYY